MLHPLVITCGVPGVMCVRPGVRCVRPGVRCVRPGVKCVRTPSPSTRASLPFLLLLPLLGCLVCLIPGTECLDDDIDIKRHRDRRYLYEGPVSLCAVNRLVLTNVSIQPTGLVTYGKAPYIRCMRSLMHDKSYCANLQKLQGGGSRIQLFDTMGEFYDAFVPIPTQCLGNRYFLAAPIAKDGTCVTFLHIVNPFGYNIQVEYVNPFLKSLYPEYLQIGKNSIQTIKVASKRLELNKLTSKHKFGVIVGAINCTPVAGERHHMVDMVPDTTFFTSGSTNYVVPYLPQKGAVVLFIMNFDERKVAVIKQSDFLGSRDEHSVFELNPSKSPKTYVKCFRPLTSFQPSHPRVMFVLIITKDSFGDPSAMTVMPPEGRWEYVTVLYPLIVKDTGNSQHKAVVVIKTLDKSGLQLINLKTGMTSPLTVTDRGRSGYSTAIVIVSHSHTYLMYHSRRKNFQVLQYGGYTNALPSYLVSTTKRFCSGYKPFPHLLASRKAVLCGRQRPQETATTKPKPHPHLPQSFKPTQSSNTTSTDMQKVAMNSSNVNEKNKTRNYSIDFFLSLIIFLSCLVIVMVILLPIPIWYLRRKKSLQPDQGGPINDEAASPNENAEFQNETDEPFESEVDPVKTPSLQSTVTLSGSSITASGV